MWYSVSVSRCITWCSTIFSCTFVACDRYLFGDRKRADIFKRRNCMISRFLCKGLKMLYCIWLEACFLCFLACKGELYTGHDCAVCAITAVKVFVDLCWETGLCAQICPTFRLTRSNCKNYREGVVIQS